MDAAPLTPGSVCSAFSSSVFELWIAATADGDPRTLAELLIDECSPIKLKTHRGPPALLRKWIELSGSVSTNELKKENR